MVLGASTVGMRSHKRLQPVERAVAADADQPFDPQPPQTIEDLLDGLLVVRVDVVARAPQDRAALGRDRAPE